MYAFRCLKCGCVHGWIDHPTVTRVRQEKREPIVAGSLEPGMTGVNVSWQCPACGVTHRNEYEEDSVIPPSTEQIRLRAYLLWETAGCPSDESLRFWRAAEEELRPRKSFEMIQVGSV
jgi:predicted nucleic-acid-binding Zn-ribbon protein